MSRFRHPIPRLFAAALALGAVLLAARPAWTASDIGVATKVVRDALARTINKQLKSGDGLRFNEVVSTGQSSALQVRFNDASTLVLGEDAEIILDSLVYQPNTGTVTGTFRVLSGVLRFKAGETKLDLKIDTPSGTIGIRGTEFDLLTTPTATEINMLEGVVEISSAAGNATVSAGQTYRMSAGAAAFLATPSPTLRTASARMLSLIAGSDEQEAQGTRSSFETASVPGSGQTAVPITSQSASGSNRVVMELASGPVVIQLREDLAPNHVKRMRELASAGAFDGVAFQFVSKGYVAETALPNGAAATIAAELSAVPFERGVVGMSHDKDRPDSANGKFFIALGRAAVLDGKYTVWGKVISGMEHLDALKTTRAGQTAETIKTFKLSN
jgi:peptidylprolyl isomerase